MRHFFSDLVGQSQAIEILSQAILQDHIAPAYLFVGPPGIGKARAARCFTTALFLSQESANQNKPDRIERSPTVMTSRIQQGNHPDLLWVEPTYLHQGNRISATEAAKEGIKRRGLPQIRLEQIREITQFLSCPPLEAPRSVVVLDQCERMAEAAANALLKTLEEPGQATLILLAPSVDALLPTLVSRCQRIPFYRLSQEAIAHVLQSRGHLDILQHPELLATAQGSPGEAIASWTTRQSISSDLLALVAQPPPSLRQALDLARQIARELDTDAQLWLLDYLQHQYWQRQDIPTALHTLETARRYLLSYAQAQLVWEVALMNLINA